MDAVGLLVDQIVIVSFAALLVWAAYSDFAKFIIPNKICFSILALYPSFVLSSPVEVDWVGGLAVGAAVFAVGFVLFVMRWTGGGDAKLLAAVAVWAGPSMILELGLFTAFAGGLVSLAYVLKGLFSRPAAGVDAPIGARLMPMLKAHIPYGIAISWAGLLIAIQLFKTTLP